MSGDDPRMRVGAAEVQFQHGAARSPAQVEDRLAVCQVSREVARLGEVANAPVELAAILDENERLHGAHVRRPGGDRGVSEREPGERRSQDERKCSDRDPPLRRREHAPAHCAPPESG
jgi:hypothetical protein